MTLYYFIFNAIEKRNTNNDILSYCASNVVSKVSARKESIDFDESDFIEVYSAASQKGAYADHLKESSMAGTITSTSFNEEDVKFIEENIDFSKTPRSLFIMRSSFNLLLVLAVLLASFSIAYIM